MKVYLNEEIVDKENLNEVFEPGFLFGWGAFETLRVYGEKIPFLDMHLERLKKGLNFLELEYPQVNFKEVIDNLLSENKLEDAHVRITVFKKRKSPGVIVYAAEFDYYKEDSYQRGAKAIFSSFRRYSQDPFLRAKSISYAKSRVSWFNAQKQGKDEAIFLNEKGFIQEGSRSNVFFIKNKDVFTPSIECGVLDGVTRRVAIDICRREGIKVIEGEFSKEDLLPCDEAFLTSSLMEVMPLVECEGKILGGGRPGKITLEILAFYRNICIN